MNKSEQRAAVESRRDAIVAFVMDQVHPVSRDEIAFGTGLNAGTISKDMHALLLENRVAGRQETKAERLLRYGGTTRAAAAVLYHSSSPVPERTQRVVVPGFVAECNIGDTRMSRGEVNARLGRVFKNHYSARSFNIEQLVTKSGVLEGTLHQKLRDFEEAGFIEQTGVKNRRRRYRVVNRARLLQHLGVQYELVSPSPTPLPVPEPQPLAVATSSEPDAVNTAIQLLRRLDELPALERNAATMRVELERLETQINEVRELKALIGR